MGTPSALAQSRIAQPNTQSFTESVVHVFCIQSGCVDGANPESGVIQASDGNFYGTTKSDGQRGFGTVFQLIPTYTLTTLYSFCETSGCTDGENPSSNLIQASDGNFYGTTEMGGANSSDLYCPSSCGTIFRISTSGTFSTIYSFCAQANCVDGAVPFGALVQGADGNLYGTTAGGGASEEGTIFKLTLSGTLTTLYSFCADTGCPDGSSPNGYLLQGSDGNFCGLTESGGGSRYCEFGCGTIFKFTPPSTLTTLHTFCAAVNSDGYCIDGSLPVAGLVEGANSDFYGTTTEGGTSASGVLCEGGCGTIFSVTSSGTLSTLYNFCAQSSCTDGSDPNAGLMVASDGNFYGAASGDGANDG
jgi:uncharacterized repeat protein (TIGR03803 family)